MNTLLWISAGLAIAIVVHVAGHVVCAWIGGIPIRLISVGEGPVLLHGRVAKTQLELRLLPVAGFVVPDPVPSISTHWMLLFILGGVLGNGTVILLSSDLPKLYFGWEVPLWPNSGLTPVIWAQVFVIVVNLIPFHSIGARLPSDGQRLLEFLKGAAADVNYMELLRRYTEGREPQLSIATPRVVPLITENARWTNAEARHSIHCTILSELERREMSRDEELLMLDCVMTDVLIFGDQAPKSPFRSHLDEWSKRAFELGPNIKSIRASRGGVLVELGHYADGKALLVSVGDGLDYFDALMRDVFLARAEHALGDNEAARQRINAAEQYFVLAGGDRGLRQSGLGGVVAFVDRVKKEIGLQT